MRSTCITIAAILLVLGGNADAGRFGFRFRALVRPAAVPLEAPMGPVLPEPAEALAAVNQARASRGLPPFQECPLLTAAAKSAAVFRAARRIAGHTADDFAHVPAAGGARAAGCAAWPVELGWGACCTYENYSHAGAAWVVGANGLRYMHLFVR